MEHVNASQHLNVLMWCSVRRLQARKIAGMSSHASPTGEEASSGVNECMCMSESENVITTVAKCNFNVKCEAWNYQPFSFSLEEGWLISVCRHVCFAVVRHVQFLFSDMCPCNVFSEISCKSSTPVLLAQ